MFEALLFISVFAYLVAFTMQISTLRKRDTHGSLDLLFSLSFLVILTSGSAYLGIHTMLIISLTIVFFIILQFFKNTKIKSIKPSLDMLYFYFTFFIFYFLFGATSSFVQKLYVNPDPYGYATVIGATDRYGSFPNLIIKGFKQMTGSDFSFNIDWSDPSQVANKIAPWSTPDASLKYGIGNGIYLHNGLSYLLRPLVHIGRINETFVFGWKFFTILSSALLLSLILKFIISFIKLNQNKDDLNLLSKSRSYLFLKIIVGFVLIILTLNSRWLPVFIIEGFGNQILSYAMCIGVLVWLVELNENMNNLKNIYARSSEFLILPTALFFVYAQQLPFQFLCLIAGVICIEKFNFRLIRNKILYIVPGLGLTLFFLLKIPIVSTALSALNSSGGGGSTHLGVLPLYKVSGLLPDLNFGLSASQDNFGKYLQTQKLWPNSGYSGTGWMLVGQGYDIYIRPLFLVWIEIVLFIFLLIFLNLLSRKRIVLGLTFLLSQLFILQSYYLYTHTGNYIIKNPDNSFNDYVWVRLLAFLSIFIWIQILLVVSMLYLKYFKIVTNKFKKFSLPIVILMLFTWSMTNTYQIANQADKYSQATIIFKDCPKWLKSKEPNYFLTNNIFPELLITLCPVDIRFISDQFTAVHKADNKTHDVTQIVYSPDTRKWEINRIGTLLLNKDLQSPCDLRCLMNSGMFTRITQ
jgi:hypothetical protein